MNPLMPESGTLHLPTGSSVFGRFEYVRDTMAHPIGVWVHDARTPLDRDPWVGNSVFVPWASVMWIQPDDVPT